MSQTAMRVSDQWGGNHVFFRCCCFGTAMRVKNKYGPFGSLGGLVAGSVLPLAFVEVPYFSSRTYGISTAVFCALALLSCIQLTVSVWPSTHTTTTLPDIALICRHVD